MFTIISTMDNITNLGMLPYCFKILYVLCMLVCFTLFVLFIMYECMHYLFILFFNKRNKMFHIGVLWVRLRSHYKVAYGFGIDHQNLQQPNSFQWDRSKIIFTSLVVHAFNVPFPSSLVQEKHSKEVDLLQCYVSNPSMTTLVCTTHLPPNLQSFITTPSITNWT